MSSFDLKIELHTQQFVDGFNYRKHEKIVLMIDVSFNNKF